MSFARSVLGFVLISLLVATSVPAAPATYAQQLTIAQKAAAEKSWSRARDAYEQLLPLAPDDETRQWVQLWLLDAKWHTEDVSGSWQASQRWRADYEKAFADLLKPYDDGRSQDERYIAVLTSRAKILWQTRDVDAASRDELAIADHLAGRAPTSEAKTRYLAFLRQLPADFQDEKDKFLLAQLLEHLDRAGRLADTAEDRAWFVFHAAKFFARMSGSFSADRAARWAATVQVCTGTVWAARAKAEAFLPQDKADFGSSAMRDLPARLPEARALLAALPDTHGEKPEIEALRSQLKRFDRTWTEPWLAVRTPEYLRPGQPLRLSYGSALYTQLTATLYRHTVETWAAKPQGAARLHWEYLRAGIVFDREEYKRFAGQLATGSLTRVHSLTQPLSAPPSLAWQQGSVEILPAMEPGFYTLEIKATDGHREDAVILDVVVTALRAVATGAADNRAMLHIYQMADGRAVADQPLQVALMEQDRHTLWSGRLNTDGVAEVPLPVIESKFARDWGTVGLAAMVGGQPVVLETLPYRDSPPSLVADLVLDRELYRPGETVHWKLAVREFSQGQFSLTTPATPLRLNFQYDDRDTLAETAVTLNAFGTAHGEFILPSALRPGFVQVQLYDGKGDAGDRYFPGFRVDNYRVPPMQARVELVSPPEVLRPGQEITVRVQADYYSGGPVMAAPVKLMLRVTGATSPPDAWLNTRREDWKKTLEEKPFGGFTDAQGRFEVRLKLPDFLLPDTQLSWHADISPEGGAVGQAEANWRVTAAGYTVATEGWTAARAARLGAPLVFESEIHDGRDLPAAFHGLACLVERRWHEAWLNPAGEIIAGGALLAARRQLGLADAAALPAPWKQLHRGYGRAVVTEQPVRAGADGKIAVSFPAPRAGIYQLELRTSSDAPALALAGYTQDEDLPLTLVAADETTTTLPFRPGTHILAMKSAVGGRPQSFLGLLPEGDSLGLFALEGAGRTVMQRVKFSDRVGWIEVAQPPPQSAMSSAWLMPLLSEGNAGSVTFPVADDTKQFRLTLSPSAAVSAPGSAATVSLIAGDRSGQPVSAEIAVSVTDEAVNALGRREAHAPPFWGRLTPKVTYWVHDSAKVAAWEGEKLSDPRPGAFLVLGDRDHDPGVIVLTPYPTQTEDDRESGYLRSNSVTASRLNSRMADASFSGGKQLILRQSFSSTAAWAPELTTDAAGKAQLAFHYPDNLTQWRIEASAVSRDGHAFGQATAFTQTSLPFQARLEPPRFLIAGDTAELAGTFVSRMDAKQSVAASLDSAGSVRLAPDESPAREGLSLAAQGETTAAWRVQATAPGEAEFTLRARAGVEADGMSLRLPVQADGFWQKTAASTCLAGESPRQAFEVVLPAPLDPARARVELQLSPGVYPALLDALPYLVDYPYGCTEQTVSRFLPAAVVRKTLVDFGLDAAAVERRIMAAENPAAAARRKKSAGLNKLDDVIRAGLSRLAPDSDRDGFGWWPGSGRTDPWMTAYVAWGLGYARQAGVSCPGALEGYTVASVITLLGEKSTEINTRAWALAATRQLKLNPEQTKEAAKAFAVLYADRDRLSAHGRACLAVAAATFGAPAEREILLRNLETGLARSTAAGLGDTVHWGAVQGYWRATDGAVETTALTLLALLELNPSHPLADPAANWLMLNRRSAGWTNTRDTAFAVIALSAYVKARQQFAPDDDIGVVANGRSAGHIQLTPAAVLAGRISVQLAAEVLRPGKNQIELRRHHGKTTLYVLALTSAWAEYATTQPAGHLIEATRQFERHPQVATLAGTLRIETKPFGPDDHAAAGETVTAIVSLTVPNELEYVMVEVPRPAGCEPFNALSGWDAKLRKISAKPAASADEDDDAIYREEHDDRSAFFLDHLPAGTWEIRFALRATTPGDYRAAPVKVEAMYAPEIRANTEARRVKITPRQ